MPVLCNEFRRGGAACLAGEVGDVKMGLNIGFETFGSFVSRKLQGHLYSDFKLI